MTCLSDVYHQQNTLLIGCIISPNPNITPTPPHTRGEPTSANTSHHRRYPVRSQVAPDATDLHQLTLADFETKKCHPKKKEKKQTTGWIYI